MSDAFRFSRSLSAPFQLECVQLGAWMQTPDYPIGELTEFSDISIAVRQAIARGRVVLALSQLATIDGAFVRRMSKLLKHGDVVVWSDFAVSHVEQIDGDFVFHQREGRDNMPFAMPPFFFDQVWRDRTSLQCDNDAHAVFIPWAMSAIERARLIKVITSGLMHTVCGVSDQVFGPNALDVSQQEIAACATLEPVQRNRQTRQQLMARLQAEDFHRVDAQHVNNSNWIVVYARAERFFRAHVEFAYESHLGRAQLWLSRIGRRQQAARVALIIVYKLLGCGGWGLPELVCEQIAELVVHPRPPRRKILS